MPTLCLGRRSFALIRSHRERKRELLGTARAERSVPFYKLRSPKDIWICFLKGAVDQKLPISPTCLIWCLTSRPLLGQTYLGYNSRVFRSESSMSLCCSFKLNKQRYYIMGTSSMKRKLYTGEVNIISQKCEFPRGTFHFHSKLQQLMEVEMLVFNGKYASLQVT